MIALLSHLAAAELPLGIDPQAFLIQLGTFIVAFLVLRKWAFTPIVNMLEERRKTIEQGLTLGESMRAKEAALEAKVAQELHKARQQADQIIGAAEAEAKQAMQSAEDAARKRADGIMKDAHDQIKQATERERRRLEKDIVGLVSEVSETIIGEKVDAQKDAALIDKALKGRSAA